MSKILDKVRKSRRVPGNVGARNGLNAFFGRARHLPPVFKEINGLAKDHGQTDIR